MEQTQVRIENGEHAGRSGIVQLAPMEIERRARLAQRVGVKLEGGGVAWPRANCLRMLPPWRTTVLITGGPFAGSKGWCYGSPEYLAQLTALTVNVNGSCLLVSHENVSVVRADRIPGRGGRS